MRNIVITLFCVWLSACSTAQIEQAWRDRSNSQEFLKEKANFKKELGNKNLCLTTGINSFTWASNTPSSECLYSSGGFFRDNNSENANHYINQLKVLQTLESGFLVEYLYEKCGKYHCYEERSPNVIFIHKTEEQGIVDGSYLDSSPDSLLLYEYTGPFTYQSRFGPKTVHSFKKVSSEALKKAFKNIQIYNPYHELYAELGSWWKLKESLEKENQATESSSDKN